MDRPWIRTVLHSLLVVAMLVSGMAGAVADEDDEEGEEPDAPDTFEEAPIASCTAGVRLTAILYEPDGSVDEEAAHGGEVWSAATLSGTTYLAGGAKVLTVVPKLVRGEAPAGGTCEGTLKQLGSPSISPATLSASGSTTINVAFKYCFEASDGTCSEQTVTGTFGPFSVDTKTTSSSGSTPTTTPSSTEPAPTAPAPTGSNELPPLEPTSPTVHDAIAERVFGPDTELEELPPIDLIALEDLRRAVEQPEVFAGPTPVVDTPPAPLGTTVVKDAKISFGEGGDCRVSVVSRSLRRIVSFFGIQRAAAQDDCATLQPLADHVPPAELIPPADSTPLPEPASSSAVDRMEAIKNRLALALGRISGLQVRSLRVIGLDRIEGAIFNKETRQEFTFSLNPEDANSARALTAAFAASLNHLTYQLAIEGKIQEYYETVAVPAAMEAVWHKRYTSFEEAQTEFERLGLPYGKTLSFRPNPSHAYAAAGEELGFQFKCDSSKNELDIPPATVKERLARIFDPVTPVYVFYELADRFVDSMSCQDVVTLIRGPYEEERDVIEACKDPGVTAELTDIYRRQLSQEEFNKLINSGGPKCKEKKKDYFAWNEFKERFEAKHGPGAANPDNVLWTVIEKTSADRLIATFEDEKKRVRDTAFHNTVDTFAAQGISTRAEGGRIVALTSEGEEFSAWYEATSQQLAAMKPGDGVAALPPGTVPVIAAMKPGDGVASLLVGVARAQDGTTASLPTVDLLPTNYLRVTTSGAAVGILVTDPLGRNVGYNPVNGSQVTNVAGAIYTNMGGTDSALSVPGITHGQYSVAFIGLGEGELTGSIDMAIGDQVVSQPVKLVMVKGATERQVVTTDLAFTSRPSGVLGASAATWYGLALAAILGIGLVVWLIRRSRGQVSSVS